MLQKKRKEKKEKKEMANQLLVPPFSQPSFNSIISHLGIILLTINVRPEGTTINGSFKF